MKGFAVAIFCLVAAVQGRNLDVDGVSGSPASPGENPWLVHLRVTRATGGGRLETCVGSLVSSSWVLTAASCVQDARFIWLRYGTVDPIRPELVTETSIVQINPGYDAVTGVNNVALVNINRVVEFTDNIRPLELAATDDVIPAAGRSCGFGGANNAPGELLTCLESALSVENGSILAKEAGSLLTRFDLGGPLVSDGVQYGLLTDADASVYLNTAPYRSWIQQVAGI